MITVNEKHQIIVEAHGKTLRFEFAIDEQTGGGGYYIHQRIYDHNSGLLVGTPIRYRQSDSGGRLAADFPSVDPNYFVVDSNGKITNG